MLCFLQIARLKRVEQNDGMHVAVTRVKMLLMVRRTSSHRRSSAVCRRDLGARHDPNLHII
jgi:hypothetical protein